MANDTFAGIASKVLLRCPAVPQVLARDWVQSAFREVVEEHRWSWLLKRGQLTVPTQYNTGTATATAGSNTILINAPGVVAAAHVGLQFRIAATLPIYTITNFDAAANTYTLDQPWMPSNQTAKPFSVYQAYVALPSDFHSFESVIDPINAQPIGFNGKASVLDSMDPQRVASGPPRTLAPLDYFGGNPRYELWPHQLSAAVYPISYESRPVDPFDAGGVVVPTLLPSDVLLERALMYCAAWPGQDANSRNLYFNTDTLAFHRAEYDKRIAFLKKQDNEHMQQTLWYQSDQSTRRIISGSWMQSHALD